jgi:hypothetical protein
MEQMSPFIYLLNAMENAAQERDPFKAGYPARREEVLRYVAELESKAMSKFSPELKDADRYRWLKAQKTLCVIDAWRPYRTQQSDDLDAAVDRAMASSPYAAEEQGGSK